jgi:hypothetical protein
MAWPRKILLLAIWVIFLVNMGSTNSVTIPAELDTGYDRVRAVHDKLQSLTEGIIAYVETDGRTYKRAIKSYSKDLTAVTADIGALIRYSEVENADVNRLIRAYNLLIEDLENWLLIYDEAQDYGTLQELENVCNRHIDKFNDDIDSAERVWTSLG